ncbi:hypothetical protein MCHUDSM44219_00302 [Mycolicibacterium chubuense]|uniref:Uncharacterized protein n=1 Tax=Mycolicibacterium chubuense TaxID=1800 RepID=A0A0J6WQ42_MYCCU|nr:hypothetical protein MCHUDSM44219_00302 [Mycolicibacterium chubuense]
MPPPGAGLVLIDGAVLVDVGAVVVALVVSVVLEVLVDSPPSPPPQPTANTSRVAPPNTARAVLGWDFMGHLTVEGCPAGTRAPCARNARTVRQAEGASLSSPRADGAAEDVDGPVSPCERSTPAV